MFLKMILLSSNIPPSLLKVGVLYYDAKLLYDTALNYNDTLDFIF